MSLISKLSELVSPSDRSEHISTRHSLHSQTGEVRAVGTSPYFVATDVTGKEDSQWSTRKFPKTEGRIERAARSIILPRETAPASHDLVAGVGRISTSGCRDGHSGPCIIVIASLDNQDRSREGRYSTSCRIEDFEGSFSKHEPSTIYHNIYHADPIEKPSNMDVHGKTRKLSAHAKDCIKTQGDPYHTFAWELIIPDDHVVAAWSVLDSGRKSMYGPATVFWVTKDKDDVSTRYIHPEATSWCGPCHHQIVYGSR